MEFLTNVAAEAEALKYALRCEWNAQQPYRGKALELVPDLVKTRYGTNEWNFRF
ncbi:MAG: hypothetical protein KatS3mg130_1417 [Candidatus Sumerlaea sp.]|nr:MAG: hypothetical protein KatS3mg130_1417 [Candidatus Sumerlaea sp.]